MTEEQAYDIGQATAAHLVEFNVPTIGEEVTLTNGWNFTPTIGDVQECHQAMALDAEDNARQFSPFEFVAKEFNDAEDPESIWESYGEGVNDRIAEDIDKFPLSGYGLEEVEICTWALNALVEEDIQNVKERLSWLSKEEREYVISWRAHIAGRDWAEVGKAFSWYPPYGKSGSVSTIWIHS